MKRNEEALRRRIVAVCRRLDGLGFVPATDGNVSARLARGEILITPTRAAKGSLVPARLLVIDPAGRVRRGEGRPSSESAMHLAIYRLRPDVGAVVHAHPPVATGFAAARRGLTAALLPEAVLPLGPVPLAPYATPGTAEVPRSIRRLIAVHQAILLANHGALCVGAGLDEALWRMELVEHLAKVALIAAAAGGARALSPTAVAKLAIAASGPPGRR